MSGPSPASRRPPEVIRIDGSLGEGGGQVLRTALALSAITGAPVHLEHIRARRANPGLAPQHLTAIRALARLCGARLRGDALRSTELEFVPETRPRAGEYAVDVTEAAQGGSAGAVTLILQAVLLPLALAHGPSRLVLRGGTHVPHSPSFHYLAHVFLPTVAQMGLRVEARLDAWGFYPAGGGQISADLPGSAVRLAPLTWLARGTLKKVWGAGVAANLPAHIPQRIASRAHSLLAKAGLKADVRPTRERAQGPGAGLFLVAEYEHSVAGFTALGAKGKPSEQVAEEASLDLLAHHAANLPVDMHLADQLLLPAALADGTTEFATCRVTQHLLTNAAIIRQFVPAEITITGDEDRAGRVTIVGAGAAVRGTTG